MTYEVYCLNFKPENSISKNGNLMRQRFKDLDIDCNFYDGVLFTDKRFEKINKIEPIYSTTYGHLDMIHQFYYQSDKQYGIFCEDDIYLHKDFKNYINTIIDDFDKLNLDILLLGYLFVNDNIQLIDSNTNMKYYKYNNELWGAQMYMLSRNHAKTLLDRYHNGYLEESLNDSSLNPFSPDWTITKDGNRALLYPMIAVENNDKIYDHYGQKMFHNNSFNKNYNQKYFI